MNKFIINKLKWFKEVPLGLKEQKRLKVIGIGMLLWFFCGIFFDETKLETEYTLSVFSVAWLVALYGAKLHKDTGNKNIAIILFIASFLFLYIICSIIYKNYL